MSTCTPYRVILPLPPHPEHILTGTRWGMRVETTLQGPEVLPGPNVRGNPFPPREVSNCRLARAVSLPGFCSWATTRSCLMVCRLLYVCKRGLTSHPCPRFCVVRDAVYCLLVPFPFDVCCLVHHALLWSRDWQLRLLSVCLWDAILQHVSDTCDVRP